jgi:hypothetical protein
MDRTRRLAPSALLMMLILAALFSCGPDMSPNYGIQSIILPTGQEVFVKRMVWGLNGDSLVISPSKEYCDGPNARTDYIFHELGSGSFGFYYKTESDALVLYVWSRASEPEGGVFPMKVVQNELGPIGDSEMAQKADRLGLKRMEVSIDKSLKCK